MFCECIDGMCKIVNSILFHTSTTFNSIQLNISYLYAPIVKGGRRVVFIEASSSRCKFFVLSRKMWKSKLCSFVVVMPMRWQQIRRIRIDMQRLRAVSPKNASEILFSKAAK